MINSIHMYNIDDLEFFGALPTVDNPRGIIALNSTTETFVLAGLSEHRANRVYIQMLNNTRENREFQCHDRPIACLGLNHDGRFLATASEQGTKIKVWNVMKSQLLRIFRRGFKQSNIT